MLPFTHEQFLSVFAAYNQAVWPAQVLAYLLGLAVSVAVWRAGANDGRWAAGGLALMWAWTGVAYHGMFFSQVNPMAYLFGGAFVLQAALLAIAAARGRLAIERMVPGWRVAVGWSLIGYAAVLYPIAGSAAGMSYPALPMFGITPCPVTLFTWGVLLLARGVPWWLLPIPVAWSIVGGSAAFLLHVPQDWVLLAGALCAVPLMSQRARMPANG